MILLKGTTESLSLTTTSTAGLDYSISYADITTTAFSPSTTEGTLSSASTTTVLAAPAASTQRQVKFLSVINRDASITNTVLIKKAYGASPTYYLTPVITLLPGESMQYIDGQGWVYRAANGSLKGDLTAAGSDTQIQFNDGGAQMGGDPDLTWDKTTNELGMNGANASILLTTITSEPVAPSSNVLRVYSKNVAGRVLPKWVGPAGIDTPFQPAFFSNNITMWNPTTATAGVWLGTVGAGAGTYSTILPSFTNAYTAMKRAKWTNIVTTTNQVLGQRNTEAMYFRGSIAGTGGFFFYARFGFDNWTAGGRLFAGMHTGTTVVTGNPSASLNLLGFGIDAGDTAITFMHNDAVGIATKETIAVQPTLNNNVGYDSYVFCKPNDSVVYYRLVDINTGVELVNASVNTDLPATTTGMSAGVLASNAALTPVTSIGLTLNRIYVETDF